MNFFVFGLGNPENLEGEKENYAGTRHNTGREAVKYFAKSLEADDFKFDKKTNSEKTTVLIKKKKVGCFLPNTFMNKSGNAAKAVITGPKKAQALIVVYDDFQLPLGKVKISFNRSSGGHNGVESIIKAIKTEAFIRIRIGIGEIKGKSLEDFILGEYKEDELKEIKKAYKTVAQAIETIVLEGREKATSIYNAL